jgi:hypothetical protein
MVTPLLLLMNISKNIIDDKSLTDGWSLMFTSTCGKKGTFPSANCSAECKV